MCRIAAYLGPPLALSALLDGPSHGLVRQSYAPREMTVGLLNADGWGVGWYPENGQRPGLLKGMLPIWSDENAREAASAITSTSILAAVRAATPGLGVCWANTPPYRWRDRLLAHNGRIWPWTPSLVRSLRDQLDAEDELALRGHTDSELIGGLWRGRLRASGGDDLVGPLRATLRYIADLAHAYGGGLTANLVLVGSTDILAVRLSRPGPAPSLYTLRDSPRWPGATLIASEPLDDAPGWEPVPPDTLVFADRNGLRCEPV
jgi:glutamine amidotransferase